MQEHTDFNFVPGNKPKAKYVYWFFILVAILCIFGIATVVGWMVKDYDPIVVNNEPVIASPGIVTAGDFVILTIDYCKNVEVHRVSKVYLVSDHTKLELPEIEGISEPGCRVIHAPFPIPKQTPPDLYHFEFDITYDVNPLRQVQDGFNSQEFLVRGEDGELPLEHDINPEEFTPIEQNTPTSR